MIPISGLDVAKARPLAVVRPIRIPVKLPGPRLTAIASTSLSSNAELLSINSILSSKRLEWVVADVIESSARQSSGETIATLPHIVEFSIDNIIGEVGVEMPWRAIAHLS